MDILQLSQFAENFSETPIIKLAALCVHIYGILIIIMVF